MKKHYLLLLLCLSLGVITIQAQQAFVAGTIGKIPLIGVNNLSLDTTMYLSSSPRATHVTPSSDGTIMYIGTGYGMSSTGLKLYKIDAINHTVLSTLPVKAITYDLEISADDQFLFYNTGQQVFKIDAATFSIIDSVKNRGTGQYLQVVDNNTFYYASYSGGAKIFKGDFISHSIIDSIMPGQIISNMRIDLNNQYLYGQLGSGPPTIVKIDLASKNIDSTLVLQNMSSSLSDMILNDDGSTLLVSDRGFNGASFGTIRMLKTTDLSTIADLPKKYNYGYMAFAPDGKLWSTASNKISVIDTALRQIVDSFYVSSYTYGRIAFGSGTWNSINESSAILAQMKLYPNPNNGIFHISSENTFNETQLKIYNSIGALVYSSLANNTREIEINIQHLPKGVYHIKLTNLKIYNKSMTIIKN